MPGFKTATIAIQKIEVKVGEKGRGKDLSQLKVGNICYITKSFFRMAHTLSFSLMRVTKY